VFCKCPYPGDNFIRLSPTNSHPLPWGRWGLTLTGAQLPMYFLCPIIPALPPFAKNALFNTYRAVISDETSFVSLIAIRHDTAFVMVELHTSSQDEDIEKASTTELLKFVFISDPSSHRNTSVVIIEEHCIWPNNFHQL